METATRALLDALIKAAQADEDNTAATPVQRGAARLTRVEAEAALRLDTLLASPVPTFATVGVVPVQRSDGSVVEGAESLFRLADRVLGSPRRYREIQALNGLRGLSLMPGATILVPSS